MRLATRLIHHPGACCEHTGAVSPPIYQASTFKQDAVGENRGYDYSRTGNPTREILENAIAHLEGEGHGFAFSSGMAAISTCLMLFGSKDHLIVTEGLYGGSYRLLAQVQKRMGVACTFVDTRDPGAVEGAFLENTRGVFVETPSNPLMRISDVGELSHICREREALLIVDNTFMSPYLQRPMEHGADIVIHSATKFLGGHSDLVAGLAVARDEAISEKIHHLQNAVGAILSPFDSWLLMRGMKTLGVRMDRGQKSATQIAQWLEERPEIEQVLYPTIDGFEDASTHMKQSEGPGAVLSFKVSQEVSARKLVEHCSVWTLAVSLGAVESIMTLCSEMTHLPYPKEQLKRLGVTDSLVRLSVGVEDPADLIEDLEQALEAARKEG